MHAGAPEAFTPIRHGCDAHPVSLCYSSRETRTTTLAPCGCSALAIRCATMVPVV
jgi:hypothetical protein